eukprot:3319171-Pleurochrysis_carterae.AAC.1
MNTQAQALKQQGNDAFSKGKIGAAIDAYSEAICLEPSNAVRCLHLSARPFSPMLALRPSR